MILDLGKVSLIAIPANLISDLPASACMILSGLTALTAKFFIFARDTAGLADLSGVCAFFSYQFIEGACGGSSFVFERLDISVSTVVLF